MSETETIPNEYQDEEILSKNYWKIVNKEISNILKDLNGLVLITHNSIEFSDMITLFKKIHPEDNLKILYLSLTRSYDFMKLALQSDPLENKKFYFYDFVSSFAFSNEETKEDVEFLKPPRNLKEMNEILKEGAKTYNPDMVIIDSLSQFINFLDPSSHEIGELFRFLHHIRTRSLNAIQKTYLLFYDKKPGVMQHLPILTAHMILNIEVIKGDPTWVG